MRPNVGSARRGRTGRYRSPQVPSRRRQSSRCHLVRRTSERDNRALHCCWTRVPPAPRPRRPVAGRVGTPLPLASWSTRRRGRPASNAGSRSSEVRRLWPAPSATTSDDPSTRPTRSGSPVRQSPPRRTPRACRRETDRTWNTSPRGARRNGCVRVGPPRQRWSCFAVGPPRRPVCRRLRLRTERRQTAPSAGLRTVLQRRLPRRDAQCRSSKPSGGRATRTRDDRLGAGVRHQRSGYQAGAAFSFDGRTLYFNAALNSRPGFGRYDLFVTTRSRDTGSHAR
ncbi:hypothetical protein LuPra_00785 [Luteitalea pratensis]|uniref:Uncharacterized protein n=1 Tax=Luteitalea pratensis TaxID=1855912 RepID=A0A143PGH1_LUTPR|nr:hypothetical protein LuPra_00785 [Luteitalea pratensis]